MPRTSTKGDRVREELLDAAEELFADRGFFGASVRDITAKAGMRLAAVNYHFESKEELFRAVLVRRAAVVNEERLERLSAVPRTGSAAVRTRAVVEAFVAPALHLALRGGTGFRNYLRLVAQIANARHGALGLVAEPYNRVARSFVAALRQVFPRAPERALQHAYQLLLSNTLYAFADNRRLESLTQGSLRSADFAAIGRDLVDFATAGIAALCGPRAGRRRRPGS